MGSKNNNLQMPLTGMGRANDILPFLPFERSTLWSWVKQGKFPAPIKLSKSMTVWSYPSVHEWLNTQFDIAAS